MVILSEADFSHREGIKVSIPSLIELTDYIPIARACEPHLRYLPIQQLNIYSDREPKNITCPNWISVNDGTCGFYIFREDPYTSILNEYH